jgi:GTP-binding protein
MSQGLKEVTFALVGRPNVGKSALFNRMVGQRSAIVEEMPGVTRDRHEQTVEWSGSAIRVMDTGGWIRDSQGIEAQVSFQAELAMRMADVVGVVVDATTGPVTEDEELAKLLLRNRPRAVILVANKADNDQRENQAWEFAGLGLGEPVPVSALHGRGVGELMDKVAQLAREPAGTLDSSHSQLPRIALVGRPNVGKSSILNRLLGQERVIVHDTPGTTRDAIDTVIGTENGELCLVDTAGIGRGSVKDKGVSFYAVVRSQRAIESADVAVLVLDASEGIARQDERIAAFALSSGCSMIVLANKWDLLDGEQRESFLEELEEELWYMPFAPILRVSAKTGAGITRIIPTVWEVLRASSRRIPTGELNRAVAAFQAAHSQADSRVLYAAQVKDSPPTFALFTTKPLSPAFTRYLERRLRESFDLGPTPVKFQIKTRQSTRAGRIRQQARASKAP